MVSNVPIDWPVGRRTSPYRLNTGMWWTGSVKSSNSTILSCLSPRRPCCGPNAAVTLEPGRDERIEAVREVAGDRCRMGEDRDAFAFQRLAQFRLGEQPVNSEQGHERAA